MYILNITMSILSIPWGAAVEDKYDLHLLNMKSVMTIAEKICSSLCTNTNVVDVSFESDYLS